ncbi:MAG: FecCD family ABC transporter permease [Fibrobacterota bacterium]
MLSPSSKGNSLLLGGLFLCLAAAFVWALSAGSHEISLGEVRSILIGHYLLNQSPSGIAADIVLHLRLPRIILALFVGGGLSISGVVLQAVFRNPLVEPYTLGVSGGASLVVAAAITLSPLPGTYAVYELPLAGFIGSLSVITILWFSARRSSQGINTQGILLRGIMISFFCSSLVMFIMALSPATDITAIFNWLMGSLEQPLKPLTHLTAAVSLAGLILFLLLSTRINGLYLGADTAAAIGINPEKTVTILLFSASIVTGISVSATGIIGFVGLVIPHLIRLRTGNNHFYLLVGSWLGGGLFLIICDTLSRTLLPHTDLPIGVITGILGAIIFIILLHREESRG